MMNKSFDVSTFPGRRQPRLVVTTIIKRIPLFLLGLGARLIFSTFCATTMTTTTTVESFSTTSNSSPRQLQSFVTIDKTFYNCALRSRRRRYSTRRRYSRRGTCRLFESSSGNPPSSSPPSPSSSPPTEGGESTVSNNKLSRLYQCYTFLRIIVTNVLHRGMQKEESQRGDGNRWQRRRRRSRFKLVESATFQGLSDWAFSVCDSEGDGKIQREELYTGVLLVHLHLAKYVGVAACQPLNRTQVGELFDIAASHNNAKTIGQREFEDIVVYSCAQIGSRIGVYYSMLLVLAPFLTGRLLRAARFFKDALHLERYFRGHWGPWFGTLWTVGEWLVEHTVSVSIFVLAVPWAFTMIDPYTRRLIKPRKKSKNVFWWQNIQNVQKQLLVATSMEDVQEVFRNATTTASEDNNTTATATLAEGGDEDEEEDADDLDEEVNKGSPRNASSAKNTSTVATQQWLTDKM